MVANATVEHGQGVSGPECQRSLSPWTTRAKEKSIELDVFLTIKRDLKNLQRPCHPMHRSWRWKCHIALTPAMYLEGPELETQVRATMQGIAVLMGT